LKHQHTVDILINRIQHLSLAEVSRKVGGFYDPVSDTIKVLPQIYILYQFCLEDEESPPQTKILFSDNANDLLSTECLEELGILLAKMILKRLELWYNLYYSESGDNVTGLIPAEFLHSAQAV
jgi:hypothetical protein